MSELVSCRCAAVHPGYGFLSENVDFVEACESKGIAFLGPTADTMRMFSRKHTAREFAAGAQCPVLPGAPGTYAVTFMWSSTKCLSLSQYPLQAKE